MVCSFLTQRSKIMITIYKDGIYKTIEPSEYGLYQLAGFKKVTKVERKPVEEKVEEVVEPEEKEEVVAKPKPKTKKAKQ